MLRPGEWTRRISQPPSPSTPGAPPMSTTRDHALTTHRHRSDAQAPVSRPPRGTGVAPAVSGVGGARCFDPASGYDGPHGRRLRRCPTIGPPSGAGRHRSATVLTRQPRADDSLKGRRRSGDDRSRAGPVPRPGAAARREHTPTPPRRPPGHSCRATSQLPGAVGRSSPGEQTGAPTRAHRSCLLRAGSPSRPISRASARAPTSSSATTPCARPSRRSCRSARSSTARRPRR